MNQLRNFLFVMLVFCITGPKLSSALSIMLFSFQVKELVEITADKSDEEIKGEAESKDSSFKEKPFNNLVYNNHFNNLWKLLLPVQRKNKACFYYYPEIFTPPPEFA